MREGRHEGKHGHNGHHGHRGHWDERGHGHHHKHFKSAQTFRRGRALAFLEKLKLQRATLLQQLELPEYEAIKLVVSGELKAVDTIIQEFIHTFELHEIPADLSEADAEGNEENASADGEENANEPNAKGDDGTNDNA